MGWPSGSRPALLTEGRGVLGRSKGGCGWRHGLSPLRRLQPPSNKYCLQARGQADAHGGGMTVRLHIRKPAGGMPALKSRCQVTVQVLRSTCKPSDLQGCSALHCRQCEKGRLTKPQAHCQCPNQRTIRGPCAAAPAPGLAAAPAAHRPQAAASSSDSHCAGPSGASGSHLAAETPGLPPRQLSLLLTAAAAPACPPA